MCHTSRSLPTVAVPKPEFKCDCEMIATYVSKMLASYVAWDSFMVATPDPVRPLFRQSMIRDNENASTFSKLRFTADGSTILMHFHHKDGRSATYPLDSSTFDDLIIDWNDTVSIQLDGFTKKSTVKKNGKVHLIRID